MMENSIPILDGSVATKTHVKKVWNKKQRTKKTRLQQTLMLDSLDVGFRLGYRSLIPQVLQVLNKPTTFVCILI